MPEPLPSPADAVLGVLGYAVFVRGETGALRLLGDPPPWLRARWPALDRPGAELPLAETSPFLENFLLDAAETWAGAATGRARSGPWVEGENGLQLEATALLADGRAVLLIERLGEAFEHQKAVLQRARENVLAHQRLNAELQKKELLLHCVADEMNGALGNVITSLRLIEREHDPTKIRRLLDLAGQATRQQQSLIHHTLETFADELRDLYGATDAPAHAGADPLAAVRRAADAASPAFAEKRVRLSLSGPAAPVDNTRRRVVSLDADRLERVLANLLENALGASSPGGEVAVRVEPEAEWVRVRVEDTGAPLPADESETLFARFGTATSARPPAAALRLHYCRMAVENAGGEIGHAPRDHDAAAGNCFWIRLPLAAAFPTATTPFPA